MALTITALPAPPHSNTPGTYSNDADTFFAAMAALPAEANAQAAGVETDKTSAAAERDTASTYSDVAETYKDKVLGGVVAFFGDWSLFAGPIAHPATIYHDGMLWRSTPGISAVMDVSTEEPGVSAYWEPVLSLDCLFLRLSATSITSQGHRVTTISYAEGNKMTFSYDADGLLTAVGYYGPDGATLWATKTITYTDSLISGMSWS